uniref:Tudor domain-containing protein n=1 Tax=Noctiluca scintillans TaxID=2966 RepID=A0A7S1AFL9_NOCSC|mmetsp:Transcript_44219/g.117151  ORF Transcript_44219/g.117151 Transcript_44219/m.117151 type:complete len:458 (+) Transcript_44219:91-1464(+)
MVESLSVGTRLMAIYDGEMYAAEVINVSKKRINAPVKVHFVGYDDEWDSWLPVSGLKSKLLPKITKTPELPKRVDYSGLETGMRVQAEADGVWYAAEVQQVSKAKKHARAPVKVSFLGYTAESDEWVGESRLRSKVLKPFVEEGKIADKAKKSKEKPDLGKVDVTVAATKDKVTKQKKKNVGDLRKRVVSLADPVARFDRAKDEKNERYLNITSVYKTEAMKGKKVLVVGASRGLGLEIVKALSSAEAEVIATVRTSNDELSALKIEVIDSVEVTNLDSLVLMASQIKGPLDYVIFNAGYSPDIVDNLDSLQESAAIKQIDVCAIGPLRCVSALKAAGLLKATKIAVISSQAGSTLWRSTQNKGKGGDYGRHMSRAACNMCGVLMAEELKNEQVPIVLLHPGSNRTKMCKKSFQMWDVEGAVEPSVGALRVLHEVSGISMAKSGKFINCEDGLFIPW